MSSVFLQLFNMSITAGWIVLAVLLLRLCLKKSPRWITCLLWGVVALRLLLPFNIESPFSVIPSATTVVQSEVEDKIVLSVDSGIPYIDQSVNQWLTSDTNDTKGPSTPTETPDVPIDSKDSSSDEKEPNSSTSTDSPKPSDESSVKVTTESVLDIAVVVWLVGCFSMLIYEMVSTLIVRRRVWDSVLLRSNVWQSDRIETPFIFGFFRPRIYVPYALENASLDLVVAHERAHLRRGDHWVKPFAFTLLSIYWYNPLLWVAYFLLCRDIEVACDERVVKDLTADDRRLYAAALLKCGTERRSLMGCPLAFGELSVKQRIFSIMSYRKPMVLIVIISLFACVLAAACLLTVPQTTIAQGVIGQTPHGDTSVTGSSTTTPSNMSTVPTSKLPTSSKTTLHTTSNSATNPHKHTYGEWRIVAAPECESEGRRERICGCGQVEIDSIDAVGHTYIRNVCVTCGDTNGTSFIPDYSYGQANTVGNENGSYYIARQDQWLYFSSNNCKSIAKCRVDGTGWTNVYTIREGFVRNINVVGDWIYFFVNIEIGNDPYIAKVRTDGSEFSYVIQSVNVSEMLVVRDTLYFTTIRNPYYDYNNDCSPLYSMSLSGGMTKQIHDGYVSRLASNGSFLFFEHTPENGKKSLRRIDLSTMKRSTIIASYNGRQLLLKDNYLYFQETDETTGEYLVKCISYTTGQSTTHGTMHGLAWFSVIGNCVYYYGGIPGGDEWWNGEVGIVEYYPRGNEYEVIYPYNDIIECIALGDCLVWHDYNAPLRIYDYYSETWIEVSSP